MLFTEPLSLEFYFLYTFSGITDMVDGTVARKMNSESKTGAVLDSLADLIFLLVAFIKLFPLLSHAFPPWIISAVILIAFIRLSAYAIGALKFHKFIALHTIANKITGVALFCVPYIFLRIDINLVSIILCIIAGISSIEELLIDMKSRHHNPDIKSIFNMQI
jgi:CDP-diacylglycerol--glycerol-3-phosphate 3-phosphatidyltransferase